MALHPRLSFIFPFSFLVKFFPYLVPYGGTSLGVLQSQFLNLFNCAVILSISFVGVNMGNPKSGYQKREIIRTFLDIYNFYVRWSEIYVIIVE